MERTAAFAPVMALAIVVDTPVGRSGIFALARAVATFWRAFRTLTASAASAVTVALLKILKLLPAQPPRASGMTGTARRTYRRLSMIKNLSSSRLWADWSTRRARPFRARLDRRHACCR